MMTTISAKKSRKVERKVLKTEGKRTSSKKLQKHKWRKFTPKTDIKFINPEKATSKKDEPSDRQISESNWDKLKKVIADQPHPVPTKRKKIVEKKKKKPGVKKTVDEERTNRKRKASPIGGSANKRRLMSNKTSYAEKVKSPVRTPTIWFDDVDPELLEYVPASESAGKQKTIAVSEEKDECSEIMKAESKLVKPASYEGLTSALAMDCEMVGGDNKASILARVSIVNLFGHCVYDTFVKPREKVTDYRTQVSGVRPQDLKDAPSFEEVQKKVAALVEKRVLVGHALKNDLQVLYLSHPWRMVRDTSRYHEFRKLFNGRTPSLKNLTERLLAVTIQGGEHNSIEDARAAMRLYTLYKIQWEKSLKNKRSRKPGKSADEKT